MRTVTISNTERDFFSFMSKQRKHAYVLPVIAQNKSILHMTWTKQPSIRPSDLKTEPIMLYEEIMLKISGAIAP